jgi:hypothetical protein
MINWTHLGYNPTDQLIAVIIQASRPQVQYCAVRRFGSPGQSAGGSIDKKDGKP